MESFLAGFADPVGKYRPFARWWWFGTAEKTEIGRELKGMAEKGFGGVEIQTVYAVEATVPVTGHENVQWLSDKWVDLVASALAAAGKHGLQVDLTFGSGWPFGGPHIDPAHASTRIQPLSTPVDAGDHLEIGLEELADDPEKIAGIWATSKAGMLIHLSPLVTGGTITWDVPGGDWSLTWSTIEPTGQRVKRASPGAEGLVLDHLNSDSLRMHAREILQALSGRLGEKPGRHFGAFFCDSWEVYGENWTKRFPDSFKARHGYEITPHMGDILSGKCDPDPDAVGLAYDYRKHHGDLILEEFFAPFTGICHEAGTKSRVQPYPAPTDVLRAYGMLDICEIEGFGRHGISTLYYGNVDPRLASSGAHVYGKEMVSCESFTWLDEHYRVTLETLKREADRITLHGVNRIIYHGYPYSPPGAGVPGWSFYASIMANHNNTWWPYLGELNRYIARNSYLSMQGTNVADFLVYIPYHDEWSGNKGIVKDLRVELKKNGHVSDFDYINDERLLVATKVRDGKIVIGELQYDFLLIYHACYMPVDVAQKVAELVRAGMKLASIGPLPATAPGKAAEIRGDRDKPEQIFAEIIENVHVYETIEEIDVNPALTALDSSSGNRITGIQYLHRHAGAGHLFFVVNTSSEMQQTTITFRASGSVTLLDAVDGSTKTFPCEGFGENTRINYVFSPNEAKWFLVGESTGSKPFTGIPATIPGKENRVDLHGTWRVRFHLAPNPFPEEPAIDFSIITEHLFDWAERDETRTFSGTATYSTSFEIPGEWCRQGNRVFLDPGEVRDIADVRVNGMHAGIRWFGTDPFDITDFTRAGVNSLEIDVTNTLFNRVLAHDKNGVTWKPGYYFVTIDYKTFNVASMDPVPSGLLGPVSISCRAGS